MRIDNYKEPKSSFLSTEKDMNLLVNKICQNRRLQKLLHYTTPDALNKPYLNDDEVMELFGKNIKIIPKLYVDGSVLNYIIISFDNFIPNDTNPEFRDNIIEIDIICHFNQWQLKDFQLRPYRIAAELDAMLDKQKMTGIGELQFLSCNQMILTDEYAGLCLMYSAIHGGEDKKFMPNPADEEQFIKEFNEDFN